MELNTDSGPQLPSLYFRQMRTTGQVGHLTGRTIAAAFGGAVFGPSPDWVEPAYRDPNHRRFFHSVAFAALLALGLREVYRWQPETDGDRVIRGLLLIAGGAYLVHLAMDAMTKRSLPLI